jgi:DNA-binding MarR family transcriptional regulator
MSVLAGKSQTRQAAEGSDVMDRLGFVLARVGLAVNAKLQAAMTVTGLKPRHCLALLHLAGSDGVSQLALAHALDVDPSVLVSILNDLEHRGLAVRHRNPSDRRRHVVRLTEHAEAVVDEIEAAVAGVERTVLAELNKADQAALGDLLRRLGVANDAVDCVEDE